MQLGESHARHMFHEPLVRLGRLIWVPLSPEKLTLLAVTVQVDRGEVTELIARRQQIGGREPLMLIFIHHLERVGENLIGTADVLPVPERHTQHQEGINIQAVLRHRPYQRGCRIRLTYVVVA